MAYTDQQQQNFKKQYAVRRRRQLFVGLPLILIAIAFVAQNKGAGIYLGGIPITGVAPLLIIAVGVLLFSVMNWRCPACGKYLGESFNPEFCPKCGVTLHD